MSHASGGSSLLAHMCSGHSDAHTEVPDPRLPETLYATELVAPGIVHSMPEKTIHAIFSQGISLPGAIHGRYLGAREVFDRLAAVGVDFTDVTRLLEDEGVGQLVTSWNELRNTILSALADIREPTSRN